MRSLPEELRAAARVAQALGDRAQARAVGVGRGRAGAHRGEEAERDEEGHEVDPERHRHAEGADQHAADRRADEHAHVPAHPLERHRGLHLLARHDARHERVERRAQQRVEAGQQRGADEQDPRVRVVEQRVGQQQRHHRGRPELGDEHELAAVERVGQGAADQRHRHDRDELADPERANCQRRAGQVVGLERHCDERDHRAEERDELSQEQQPVLPPAQRRKVEQEAAHGRLVRARREGATLSEAKTALAEATADAVRVRGHDLTGDLMGHVTLTELFFLLLMGRTPDERERRMTDACLVSIAEHGLVPSVQAARMTLSAAPESLQGAVAAGLLGCGSVILGATEYAATMLSDGLASGADPEAIVREHREARRALPGFGHPLHRDGDPRTVRLLAISDELEVSGEHVALLRAIEAAVPEVYGRVLPLQRLGRDRRADARPRPARLHAQGDPAARAHGRPARAPARGARAPDRLPARQPGRGRDRVRRRMSLHNPEVETRDAAEQRARDEAALRTQLASLRERSPFYRDKLAAPTRAPSTTCRRCPSRPRTSCAPRSPRSGRSAVTWRHRSRPSAASTRAAARPATRSSSRSRKPTSPAGRRSGRAPTAPAGSRRAGAPSSPTTPGRSWPARCSTPGRASARP